MNKTIVIGFTGPSGSGKTTLAKWLAEQKIEGVTMHYFEGSASLTHTESQRAYLQKEYGYEPSGHQNVINLSSSNPEFGYDFQRLLAEGRYTRLMAKIKEVEQLEGVNIIITDRTFIDIAAYSALQCAHNIDDDKMSRLYTACQVNSGLFDLTFIVKPNNGWTEDNGSRVPRNFYQNKVVWPVINNIANNIYSNMAEDINYVNEPLEFWDLDLRKKTVLSALNTQIKNGKENK